MLVQMTAATLRTAGLGVYAQRQAASASLGGTALAGHVALALIYSFAAAQLVAAEALSTVLSAGHAIPSSFAVSDALRIGDFVVANISELNTGEGTVAVAETVRVAAMVRPASCDGRRRTRCRSRSSTRLSHRGPDN